MGVPLAVAGWVSGAANTAAKAAAVAADTARTYKMAHEKASKTKGWVKSKGAPMGPRTVVMAGGK